MSFTSTHLNRAAVNATVSAEAPYYQDEFDRPIERIVVPRINAMTKAVSKVADLLRLGPKIDPADEDFASYAAFELVSQRQQPAKKPAGKFKTLLLRGQAALPRASLSTASSSSPVPKATTPVVVADEAMASRRVFFRAGWGRSSLPSSSSSPTTWEPSSYWAAQEAKKAMKKPNITDDTSSSGLKPDFESPSPSLSPPPSTTTNTTTTCLPLAPSIPLIPCLSSVPSLSSSVRTVDSSSTASSEQPLPTAGIRHAIITLPDTALLTRPPPSPPNARVSSSSSSTQSHSRSTPPSTSSSSSSPLHDPTYRPWVWDNPTFTPKLDVVVVDPTAALLDTTASWTWRKWNQTKAAATTARGAPGMAFFDEMERKVAIEEKKNKKQKKQTSA